MGESSIVNREVNNLNRKSEIVNRHVVFYKKGYKAYLQLERSLSDNSVEAYMRDLEKLTQYLQAKSDLKSPADIHLKDLQLFVQWIAELGMNAASQSRVVSGIRNFLSTALQRISFQKIHPFYWILPG
jgi:integrase/recombinase XerD